MSRKHPKSDKKNGHPKTHQEHSDKEQCKLSANVHVRGEIETQFPPHIIDKHNAERKEDSARDKKRFRVECITLAIISIYAAFTFWQGWMTRKLIDNTSKQFQKDQRPYVWLSGYIPPSKIHIAKSEEMWLSIGWTNYGRSPALREAGIGKIFVGPNAMEEADKWFAGLGDNPLPGPPLKEIPIPPGPLLSGR